MTSLGRAFSIIAKANVLEGIMHEDVAAWHAPSECHGLVSRGEARRIRIAHRHARAVSGLSRRQFNQAFRRLDQRTWEALLGRIHAKLSPYG